MLSISNIAWTADEDEAALRLLAELGVSALEVAPTRIWPSLDAVPEGAGSAVAASLRRQGFQVVSFQAILFGKPDLLLFDQASRPHLLDYLGRVADLCADMGAKSMVFGAPKNRRVPGSMNAQTAFEIAGEFFAAAASQAVARGVSFGLEANPAAYGCNFCTHVDEAARLIRAVDSPGLRWHLDTGEFAMNAEDIEAVLTEHGELIGSAHISQPNLESFTDPWPGHHRVAQALRRLAGNFPISIEMKRQDDSLAAVKEAVTAVRSIYG